MVLASKAPVLPYNRAVRVTEPASSVPPHDSGDWDDLRRTLRHRAKEAVDLVSILVQDAVILVVGFLAEVVYERWLHSEQPFFRLAINLSSALFLLLYVITVTVHVVNYVRGQFGTSSTTTMGRYLPWAVAGLAVIGAVGIAALPSFGGGTGTRRDGAGDGVLGGGHVARFQIYAPGKSSFAGTGVAISPDGTTLAFLATGPSGAGMLWVRPVDAFEARALPGTEGATWPFWSPDSRFIAYFTPGALKRIDSAGGPPLTICSTAGHGVGGTWSRDGIILFSTIGRTISRVAADGGQPVPVTTLNAGREEVRHRWPSFLPDGRHFLYFVTAASPDAGGIYVGSLESSDAMRLVASDSSALYAPPGVLLFMRGGTLLRQRFDAGGLAVQGEATPLTERVARDGGTIGAAGFSASANGVLAFRSAGAATTQFTWFDRSGRVVNTVGPPGSYRQPALSPDETRVAFARLDDQGLNDLWLLDLSRSVMSRFTFNPGDETFPTWSPDGTRIFYASNQLGGPVAVFEKNASGTRAEALVLKPGGAVGPVPMQVSRDGKLLLYFENVPRTAYDIFTLPLAGSGAGPAVEGQKPVPIVQTMFTGMEPMLSPDGRWLAYVSDETGRQEVYVQPFPPSGGKWQISSGGADVPTWRGDGKEIFFVSADRKLYAVDVRAGVSFEYGVPHALFDVRVDVGGPTKTNVIPSRDGQRFLVNQLSDPTASPINVVLNWQAETGKPNESAETKGH